MRRTLTFLAVAIVCGHLQAGDMALGFSLGLQQPTDKKKINLASDTIFQGAGFTLNSSVELGVSLAVVHGERFSSRWGWVMPLSQKVDIAYPNNQSISYDRGGSTFYVQGNFNIINGVGKTWYLTAGGTYTAYTITRDNNSGDLDKVAKAGVIFGTGVSFNGKTLRWTPEVLVQKTGEETTGIFRLHIQYQF